MFHEDTLAAIFSAASWSDYLKEILPSEKLDLWNSWQPIEATAPEVSSVSQIGTVAFENETLALLLVETGDHILLSRNRVALRNFVAKLIVPGMSDAVLAVFHQPGSEDWRVTYAAKRTILDEETFAISTEATAPRRFTFLLGPNEPVRTASARFKQIQLKGDALTLAHIEDAFSVEKLSKEFFAKYNARYEAFLAELTSPERIADTRSRFSIALAETDEAQAKADKPIRDFAKKLLGRLIFLHFLQKKGWLHVTSPTLDWTQGDRDFLNTYFHLAESYEDAARFHSHYLTPLFFEALNTDRKDSVFTLPLPGGKTFNSRMPYLNGGLFDPDPAPLQSLDLPPQLFADLFSFFAEYNFTIDENDPEDHEVGIDPEMLGHIFENLLEDNKDKGAYYTPKVIVSYMCRQSLLRYLETHLGKNENLARLCEIHEPGDLREKGNWCAQNAKSIATLLENVKICDPAIGSGAFPIGMLNEIVHLRTLLNHELNDPAERAKLKKAIIQDSIHGVDLDSGAVDIARLRFWLALVTDEETPSPLPNLDYKIMQGNSLLESFHGVDLSRIHQEKSSGKKRATIPAALALSQDELDIFTSGQLELREREAKQQNELLDAIRAYFAARKPERKAKLRETIDGKVIAHIRHFLDVELEKARVLIDQTGKFLDGTFPAPPRWTEKKGRKDLATHQAKEADLASALQKLQETTRQPERPFFLWHLLFRDVFENGGFDIVIANPPYVRQELIKEQKPLIQAEGYTTFTGTADLLVYFYERAIQLLKPRGVLTFITSNKFYRAGYGEKLRTHLAENLTLHTLIDFRDAPVFNGVIAYASILIGQKETAPAAHKVAALPWDQEKPAAALPLEIAKAFPVAQSSLTADGWRLVSPATEALLAKLRQTGTPLGEYVDGRFYRGILTGFNEAFVIDGKKRAELIAADPKSEEIIKPFLRGRDVKRWQATHADLFLIFTRRGTDIEAYPAIKAHLETFREQLEPKPATWPEKKKWNGRKAGPYEWFHIQDNIAYWKEFEQPKLIMGRFMERAEYSIDLSNTYHNDALYFTATDSAADALFLGACLNSSQSWWQLNAMSTALQNGYLQALLQYQEILSIPPATPSEKTRLVTLAEQCAAATATGDTETLAAREHEINQLVHRLFHLTHAEIDLIESSTAKSPAIKIPASNQGEVYPPALKGQVWNTVKILTKKHPYISLKVIKAALEKASITTEDKTLRKYLGEAMAVGVVHDAGRGWYSGIVTPARLDDLHISELRDLLAERFPFLPHYLWSTLQLNPWMHHLFGKPIHFLHVDEEGTKDVEEFLRAGGWSVLVNPTAKSADQLVPGSKCLVIRSVKREFNPETEPAVGTVLAEMLLENAKLDFVDEAERKEMTHRLILDKRVDIAALISRLKEHGKTTSDLVGTEKSGSISEF